MIKGGVQIMKMKSFCLLLCVAFLGLSLAGCGCFMQQMKGETPPPKAAEEMKVVPPEAKTEMAVPMAAEAAAAPVIPASALADIYFDLDKYNIRADDAEILKKDAEWLKANPGQARIEGNCDERGTIEYNLALGQRRADSTKNYLVTLGVDKSRLETISYGKERPVDPGHNEAAWAKNRRAHFAPLP